MSASMILYERSGRWAASLRRHGLVARIRLVETRSLAELEEQAQENPDALLGFEFTAASVHDIVDWLSRRMADLGGKAVILFAERGMRRHELLCREAGAVHFLDSELELFALGAVVDRYLSDPAFAKLDEPEQPLAERIRATLPW
jgi:hypothetical protein